jgi:hypothetical protein
MGWTLSLGPRENAVMHRQAGTGLLGSEIRVFNVCAVCLNNNPNATAMKVYGCVGFSSIVKGADPRTGEGSTSVHWRGGGAIGSPGNYFTNHPARKTWNASGEANQIPLGIEG